MAASAVLRTFVWALLAACTSPPSPSPRCANNWTGTGQELGPYGIAVAGGYVYWTFSDGSGAVWRRPTAGGAPQVFAMLDGYPRAIAHDDAALYVAGGCQGHVWRVPLDGSEPRSLAQLTGDGIDQCVHGIAVDDLHVYITSNAGVAKLDKTGSAPIPLVAANSCSGSIAVTGATLYWVDPCSDVAPLSALSSVSIDGGTETPLDVPGAKLAGDAIAIDANAVYWASDGELRRMPLSAGMATMIAATDETFGIASDGTNVYWTTRTALMTVPISGGNPRKLADTAGPAGVALDASNVYWGGGNDCPADSVTK